MASRLADQTDTLKKRGAILTFPAFIEKAQQLLAQEANNPEYKAWFKHYFQVLKRLITAWKQHQLTDARIKDYFDNALKEQWVQQWQEKEASFALHTLLQPKITQALATTLTNWLTGQTTSLNHLFDNLSAELVWEQWKNDTLNEPSIAKALQNFYYQALTNALKQDELERDFSHSFTQRLERELLEEEEAKTAVNDVIANRVKQLIDTEYNGRPPRNTSPLYQKVISKVVSDWKGGFLSQRCTAELDKQVQSYFMQGMDLKAVRVKGEKTAAQLLIQKLKAQQLGPLQATATQYVQT